MTWDYERDFVKVPRKLLELLQDDPAAFMTYAALLSRAAWRPTVVTTKHGRIALKRGQSLCGRAELAKICAASERTTRTALNVLQRIEAIQLSATNHGTVVTIVGYATSDDSDPAGDPAGDPAVDRRNGQQAIQHPAGKTTTNEDPRSKKEDLRTPDRARAHDPTVPAPVRSPEHDAERARLHGLALRRLNEARLDVGGRLKISLRPIHPFDNKLRDAVSFLLADEIIDRFEADLEHVLQIRIAEALADARKARWISSSLFEWGAWRTALAMTLADVAPKHETTELAYAPVREEDDEPDFTYGAIGGGR